MIIKVVVSSKAHPEYGQATIPFPIPDSEYDHTIDLLEDTEIGDALAQDCRVDEITSGYPILNWLVGQGVNVDELDFVGASSISLASASGESSLIPLLLLPTSNPLRWASMWFPTSPKRSETYWRRDGHTVWRGVRQRHGAKAVLHWGAVPATSARGSLAYPRGADPA